MVDVMIDIETMGDEADAAIVSIGAVVFPRESLRLFDPGSEHGDPLAWRTRFYRNVDLADAYLAGGSISPSTVQWWMHPDRNEARTSLLYPPPSRMEDALAELQLWLASVSGDIHSMNLDPEPLATYRFGGNVWAWPPSFDLTILGSACERSLGRRLWHRRNERCARTFCMETGVLAPGEGAPAYGIKHNGLDDAIAQAILVHEAFRRLSR